MINLERLFDGFFSEPQISLSELSNYAHVSIDRMTAVNPGAVFGPRITATQVALAAVEAKTTDTGVKTGIQKGKTLNKNNQRKAIPGQLAKVHATVIAKYGKDSAEMLECFPKGLSIFSTCRDEQMENELQITLAGITAHQADLGAEVVGVLGAILSAWISTYALQGGAKSQAKASGGDLGTLRAALELECQKNALFTALTFPLDGVKGMYYLPQELLRNAKAPAGLPGGATIQQVAVDGATRAVTLRMQSLGATAMKLTRRGEFELEPSEIAAAIAVVNGVCVFTDTAPADGLWFYQAVPSNNGGEGPASPELGVQVN